MLDIVSNFLKKYKESCSILEKRAMVVKTESLSDYTDNEDPNSLSEVEIDLKKIKEEPDTNIDESQCLTESVDTLQLKTKKIKVKAESDKNKLENGNKVRSGTITNKIASSILEGDFSWTGEKWW